jgi:ABC-type branched-subunit amino acid transport system substrate-binding protein
MNRLGLGRLRVGACLSLSGRFARFGRQAAQALEAWASLDGAAEVLIEDDASDPGQLRSVLPGLATRSDLLLGPYSTLLMRTAGDLAAESDWLLWNHGGSGDNVETAHPGHVVSVLTPASRYAEPFLRHLAESMPTPPELRIAHGTGRFGRQVASGAETRARQLGITSLRTGPADMVLSGDIPVEWVLFTAGTFEDDIETVARARDLAQPPRLVCAVAAGVREFSEAITDPTGIFGIAQWFAHTGLPPLLGPSENQFLAAYGAQAEPADYPAVQAAATATIAAHCARLAGSTRREALWSAATALETRTLYGVFKIDPATGRQTGHRTVLTRWADGNLEAVHDSFTT